MLRLQGHCVKLTDEATINRSIHADNPTVHIITEEVKPP